MNVFGRAVDSHDQIVFYADRVRAARDHRDIFHGAERHAVLPGVDKLLHDRDILYPPDYVVNAGGPSQVADEVDGFSEPRARTWASQISNTTRSVFTRAEGEGIPPGQAADQ
jgi:glutamate dehydrogenase/leucine dehydrogenase